MIRRNNLFAATALCILGFGTIIRSASADEASPATNNPSQADTQNNKTRFEKLPAHEQKRVIQNYERFKRLTPDRQNEMRRRFQERRVRKR